MSETIKVEILQQKGYHFLWVDDYLWMWDIPAELEIQQDIANQCYGDVLIAGLGLGVVQRLLQYNPRVNLDEMLTIEKYREVYEAYDEYGFDMIGGIHIGDFNEAIAGCDPDDHKFDCVVGDIWPEISPKYLSDYIKFKSKAQEFLKPNGKILAWGIDYYEYLLQKVTVTP